MSRALNLSVSEDVAIAHCTSRGIGVSAVEALPGGGVRLVCMSTAGADLVRRKFKTRVIKTDVVRTAFRPTRPLW